MALDRIERSLSGYFIYLGFNLPTCIKTETKTKYLLDSCTLLLFTHQVMSNCSETPQTAACQAPLPWDFPGSNTRMGCHFLLQAVHYHMPETESGIFIRVTGFPRVQYFRKRKRREMP